MAVVCSVILAFLIGTVLVLGESTRNAFTGVANKITPGQAGYLDSSMNGTTVAANKPTEAMTGNSAATLHLQLLVILGAVCVSFLGVRYILLAKRKAKEETPAECDAELLQSQTKALRKILGKRNSIYSHVREEWIKLFEGDAQIRPYMSTDVFSVRPSLPTGECLHLLQNNGYHHVMVTHKDGRMAGVVSKKDLKTKTGDTVADVMTSNPQVVEPDTRLGIALTKLLQHRISCLPVVKDGQLVGLLSKSDFLVVLQCLLLILNDQFGQATTNQKERAEAEALLTGKQLEPQMG